MDSGGGSPLKPGTWSLSPETAFLFGTQHGDERRSDPYVWRKTKAYKELSSARWET